MNDEVFLTNNQLLTLMHKGPFLDRLALAPDLAVRLADLQKRAGDTYVSGGWFRPNNNVYFIEQAQNPPTQAEAKALLGEAYMALDAQKREIRKLMEDMELLPTFHQPSILDKAVNSVKSWFR